MSVNNNVPQRIIRRLKANGLIPGSDPILIIIQRSPRSPVKWEAVHAITGEQYRVGGTAGTMVMVRCRWEVTRREDGWVILSAGEKFPADEPGGASLLMNRTGFRNPQPKGAS
jgi:hypothetical protein